MTTKAIILAAGFGTRMKEYTQNTPKSMLPFKGKPLIEYTIRQLVSHNISDIAINLHYLPEQIKNYFGNGKNFNANINYKIESTPTGTAGGVKALESYCKNADQILVIYGDIITDLDYTDFISSHKTNDGLATICLHQRLNSNSIVEFNEKKKITKFIERPNQKELLLNSANSWVNSAIYCFKPNIFNRISPSESSDFPKHIFPALLLEGELYGYKLTANRYAIDSEEKYLEAQKNFSKFKFAF